MDGLARQPPGKREDALVRHEGQESKRDFSLRRPTRSSERTRRKRRRSAPLEMTGVGSLDLLSGASRRLAESHRKLLANWHVHLRGRVSQSKKRIFRRVPMKPMSHRRNGVLWL